MLESTEDHCERCAELRHGSRRLMFYHWFERFPQSPIAREFFCLRCQRVLRSYAIVGFTLLLGIVLAIVITSIWVTRQGSAPLGP